MLVLQEVPVTMPSSTTNDHNHNRHHRHRPRHQRYNVNHDDYTKAMSDTEGYSHGGQDSDSYALSDGEGVYASGRGRWERYQDGNESDSVLVPYNQVQYIKPQKSEIFYYFYF